MNTYEIVPYFLQISKSTDCLIVHMICKNCEPEIAPVAVNIKSLSDQAPSSGD